MRWMNKLKIAVLDNGVDEKLLASCGLPDIIQQNKGNISDEEDEYYGAAEPPVRCGESHLSGLTEPLRSL